MTVQSYMETPLWVNHDHPLVQASMILRRFERELYFAPRERKVKDRQKRFRHRDMLAHAQEYLAVQIKDTPECWQGRI